MPDDEKYEYTGLHAMIFLGGSSPERIETLVKALQEEERKTNAKNIRFATETVGGVHRGLVHVAVDDEDDLAGIQGLLVSMSKGRELGTEVAILGPAYQDSSGQSLAAKIRHCEVLAIIRIWVERDQASEVLQALPDAVGSVFDGASIVYGAFDILLVLDGPRYSDVARPALEGVPSIPGVVRTETSFADVRRYGDYATS